MTIADFVQDLKEKLGLAPSTPRFGPPVAYARPAAVPVPPANANLVPAEQPVASLVGTHNNSKGRAQDAGSLVSGR